MKKRELKFLVLLLAILTAGIFASCKSDDDDDDSPAATAETGGSTNSLEGTEWESTVLKMNGEAAPNDVTETIAFASDGTCSLTGYFSASGTYTASGSSVSANFTKGDITGAMTGTISGSTLSASGNVSVTGMGKVELYGEYSKQSGESGESSGGTSDETTEETPALVGSINESGVPTFSIPVPKGSRQVYVSRKIKPAEDYDGFGFVDYFFDEATTEEQTIEFTDSYVSPESAYKYYYRIYDANGKRTVKSDKTEWLTATGGAGDCAITLSGGKVSYKSDTGILTFNEIPTIAVTPASVEEEFDLELRLAVSYDKSTWLPTVDEFSTTWNLFTQYEDARGKEVTLYWYVLGQRRAGSYSMWLHAPVSNPQLGLPESIAVPTSNELVPPSTEAVSENADGTYTVTPYNIAATLAAIEDAGESEATLIVTGVTNGWTEKIKDAIRGTSVSVNLDLSKSTNLTALNKRAFADCEKIKSLTLPNSITSIGGTAFSGCENLATVKYVGTIAEWCNIDFDNFQSTPLRHAEEFYVMDGDSYVLVAGELEIPNTVREIKDWVFAYCKNLVKVTIPDSVKSIGADAFCECENLASVVISGSVESIGESAFSDCTNLESVVLSEGTKTIGSNAFANDTSLVSIVIPNSVTSIAYNAFFTCNKLESITLGSGLSFVDDNVFLKCSNLTKVYYTGDLAQWCAIDFRYRPFSSNNQDGKGDLYIDGKLLTEAVIPNSVTKIRGNTFKGLSSLTSVTIPSSVTSIEAGAFSSCIALANVNISAGITSIEGSVFKDCYALKSIAIPSGITSIGYAAFYGCTHIESITIPASLMSIGEAAFYECSNLTTVNYAGTIEQWCTIEFKDVNSSPFNSHDGTLNLSETEQIEAIVPSSVTAVTYAFRGIKNLKNITLPNSVTSISDGAFYRCSSLENVNIPEGVASIGSYTFCGCTSLKSITIPSTVTKIDSNAFGYCSSLESIAIPQNVTLIGMYAFYACISLKNASFADTESIWYQTTETNFTNGTEIGTMSANDTAANATLLTATYEDNYLYNSNYRAE